MITDSLFLDTTVKFFLNYLEKKGFNTAHYVPPVGQTQFDPELALQISLMTWRLIGRDGKHYIVTFFKMPGGGFKETNGKITRDPRHCQWVMIVQSPSLLPAPFQSQQIQIEESPRRPISEELKTTIREHVFENSRQFLLSTGYSFEIYAGTGGAEKLEKAMLWKTMKKIFYDLLEFDVSPYFFPPFLFLMIVFFGRKMIQRRFFMRRM